MSWKLILRPASSLASLWRTLTFRLTAGYALVGLTLVSLATASLYLLLLAELEKSTELFLGDKLNVLRTMLRERPDDWDGLREEIELESAARRYEHYYIRLLDEHNVPLLTTPGMQQEIDVAALSRKVQARHGTLAAMRGIHGTAFRVADALAPVGLHPGHAYTIEIAIDVSQQEQLLARFRLVFWIILLTTSAVFPVLGYGIARQGIRPVEEMAATAKRISSSNLDERIRTAGYPSELAALAGTFNAMLDRLEGAFHRISRFSADIAHDLRTPVNNIRGEAEVALARARTVDEYRDTLESSLEEAVRLSELISNLLFLARAESPLAHVRRAPVDVHDLIEGVQTYYEASAADGGITLCTKAGSGPLMGELDRTLLQRALGNLVSNAVAHTPPGGSVTIAAAADGAGAILLEVIDTGAGIPPEALPHVFDRFFRVDSSRSRASGGTGLGLSIVQGIVLLHGGKIEIQSQPEKGTRVALSLPATAPLIPSAP